MTRRKITLLIVVPLVFAAALILKEVTAPKPGTVEFHLAQFRKARTDGSYILAPSRQMKGSGGQPQPAFTIDYLKPKTWLWFLRGRPTIESCVDQANEHRKALVELGYFEEREYVVSGENFAMQPLLSALAKSNSKKMWITIIQKPSRLTVTAPKTEMPTVEEMIQKHISAEVVDAVR